MTADPKSDAPDARSEKRIAPPETAPYRVGYRRPPTGARFRPGESGNPRGRPKGVRNLSSVIAAELKEKVVVTENDRQRRITKLEVAVKQLVNRTAQGEARAMQLLFGLLDAYERRPSRPEPEPEGFGEADTFVIGEIVRRIRHCPQ